MIEGFRGFYCGTCGADAFEYVRTYPNPDDPQEVIYHCHKCDSHNHFITNQNPITVTKIKGRQTMSSEEAKKELIKMTNPKYVMRLGILGGVSIAFLFLNLSWFKSHWEYIIKVMFFPSIFFGLYLGYIVEVKLKKIKNILQNSRERTT